LARFGLKLNFSFENKLTCWQESLTPIPCVVEHEKPCTSYCSTAKVQILQRENMIEDISGGRKEQRLPRLARNEI